MADMVVKLDKTALFNALGASTGLRSEVGSITSSCVGRANSMSAGFKTGIRHDPVTHERQGGTPAMYDGDVQDFKGLPVGIVYTANYAAIKDNYLHNTLLKAMG